MSQTIDEALAQYYQLAKTAANQHSLDPLLILGIIYQESKGKAFTYRYEPDYNYLCMPLHYADKLQITMASEVEGQRMSWGLMQLMGGVARELGFDDYLPALCIPATNIFFGAKKLSQLRNKYSSLDDSIASYNAGSPRKTPKGVYINQAYVDNVKLYMKQLILKGFK